MSQEGTIDRGLALCRALGVHPLGNPYKKLRPRAGAHGWLCVRIARAEVGPGRWCFSKVFHVLLMRIRPRPVGSVLWFLNLGGEGHVTEPPGGHIKHRSQSPNPEGLSLVGLGGPKSRRPHRFPRELVPLVHGRVGAARFPLQVGQFRTQRGGASSLGHPAGVWGVGLWILWVNS